MKLNVRLLSTFLLMGFGLCFVACSSDDDENLVPPVVKNSEITLCSKFYEDSSDRKKKIVLESDEACTYISENEYVATVDASGTVYGGYVGETNIQVQGEGGTTTVHVKVTSRQNLYTEPSFAFGTDRATILKHYGSKAEQVDVTEVRVYNLSVMVPVTCFYFENNALVKYTVFLKQSNRYVGERHLGEHYPAIDANGYYGRYINALSEDKATKLITYGDGNAVLTDSKGNLIPLDGITYRPYDAASMNAPVVKNVEEDGVHLEPIFYGTGEDNELNQFQLEVAGGEDVTYRTENTYVAYPDKNGLIKAQFCGQTRILVTGAGGGGITPVTVTVHSRYQTWTEPEVSWGVSRSKVKSLYSGYETKEGTTDGVKYLSVFGVSSKAPQISFLFDSSDKLLQYGVYTYPSCYSEVYKFLAERYPWAYDAEEEVWTYRDALTWDDASTKILFYSLSENWDIAVFAPYTESTRAVMPIIPMPEVEINSVEGIERPKMEKLDFPATFENRWNEISIE